LCDRVLQLAPLMDELDPHEPVRCSVYCNSLIAAAARGVGVLSRLPRCEAVVVTLAITLNVCFCASQLLSQSSYFGPRTYLSKLISATH
jgi:hypothetical protein